MKEEKEQTAPKVDLATGLDGIFRGLGTLLQSAAQLADITDESAELRRTGSVGARGTRAVYGVSVRVGPAGKPRIEKFGNLRQKPGGKPVIDEFREPITDLLDEGDHFLIVAELPGMDGSAVQCKLSGQTVIITAQCGERKYRKVLSLPSPISDRDAISNYKNGILELRLCKQNPNS